MKTLQISPILISEFGSFAPGENPPKIIMFLVFVLGRWFRSRRWSPFGSQNTLFFGNSNAGESREGVFTFV
jgi:hypothetical protein